MVLGLYVDVWFWGLFIVFDYLLYLFGLWSCCFDVVAYLIVCCDILFVLYCLFRFDLIMMIVCFVV